MTSRSPVLCDACERLDRTRRSVDPRLPWFCEAFPDGIPDDVRTMRFDHRQPHLADNGLTFLLDPKRERVLDTVDSIERRQ